jgi:hypothetical protein
MAQKRRNHSRFILAFAIGILATSILAPTASAFTYNRNTAAAYADTYYLNHNTNYQYFANNDCTNFISQALQAGGVPNIGTTLTNSTVDPDAWYHLTTGEYSHSFTIAMENYPNYPTGGLVDHAYRYLGVRFDRNSTIGTLNAGDFVMFDQIPPLNMGLASHGEIGVGWLYDPDYNAYKYKVDAHSNSRYHVNWDSFWNPNTTSNWKISVHG